MSGENGDNGEPWHRILVDEEYAERMGDIKRQSVGSFTNIRMMLNLVGQDEDGKSRLPATAEIFDSLMSLPTSVNAKRAKLAAEALAYDPWKPVPGGGEWDPDDRPRPEDLESEPDPGLPRRGD